MMNDTKKQVLVLADSLERLTEILGNPPDSVAMELLTSESNALEKALAADPDAGKYDALFVAGERTEDFIHLRRFLVEYALLDLLPVGVVLVDINQRVVRGNRQFGVWTNVEVGEMPGRLFYDLLGKPTILGEYACPFHRCRVKKVPSETTLYHKERYQHFQMDVTPVTRTNAEGDTETFMYIVVLRDIARLVGIDQKLKAIQEAGKDLGDISARDLLSMTFEEQIDLLKQKIILHTQDILHYDKIEIRILSHEEPGLLVPLLAMGMDKEAMERKLYALPEGNGITGYVAYHGKRYLIDDANEDPIYLQGVAGARSSMTVPLVIHGSVIGTFNVESLEPRAFTETDIEFLETFARELANALHTMELFTVEQSGTLIRSVETIHAAVASPINMIVNEAAGILANHAEIDHDAAEKIRKILARAREIQTLIQSIGDKMVPSKGHPIPPGDRHPLLRGRSILVVDADETIGVSTNSLLLWYGCTVEMAPSGELALVLAKNTSFDIIISDIRLNDMSGYDLLLALKEANDKPFIPLILMKSFGYDREHVTVKARQAGVVGFLPKPFSLDLLVSCMERVLEESIRQNGEADSNGMETP